jgi:hypothetical protein
MMGGIAINCAIGTHTYIVTPDDVTKAIIRGTVEVTAANTEVTQPITIVTGYMIDIYVKDKNDAVIVGAEVKLNGIALMTDATGEAMFMRYAKGNYSYTVSKTGYISQTKSISVNTTDVMDVVTLLVPEYSATFTVTDGTTNLAGASVKIGTVTVTSGVDGKAVLTGLTAGTYSYTVTKAGYVTRTGSVTVVDKDVAVSVTMVMTTYAIMFNVTDGTKAIAGADVKIGTTTVVTGADGKALFTGLLPGNYNYTVTKAIYSIATGTVTITNTDVIKDITLISTVGINLAKNGSLSAYPNPTKGNLKINLPDNGGKGITICVTNIIGQVVINNKVVNSSTEFNLDLSGFDNGVYFVKVIGNGFQNSVKVVKN